MPDDFLLLAAPVAPGAAVPEGVRRAPWPAVSVATALERIGPLAAALAARMAAAVGSVGVITPSALRERVDPAFPGAARAAADAAGALTSGVNVLGLQAIKGLEFDAAIVVEPQAILDQPIDGGRGGLYTALTRSTRALAVVHAQPLPPELAGSAELQPVAEDAAADAWAAGRR